jgi:acyl carrier protein
LDLTKVRICGKKLFQLTEREMDAEFLSDLKNIVFEKFQIDNSEDLENQTLSSLGMDSLDALDFIYQVREKYDLNIPKDIENNIMSLSLKDFVPYLTRLQG